MSVLVAATQLLVSLSANSFNDLVCLRLLAGALQFA